MEIKEAIFIYQKLDSLFPDAHCELIFKNPFEMLIATVLSAQTTDIAVNKVTPTLFTRFPDASALSKAAEDDVINIIKPIGLAKTKAHNIVALAKMLVNKYDGVVPNSFEELVTLPGVGRKTANVVLAEALDIPRIGVDTHVSRVARRLKLVNSDDLITIEEKLMTLYPKELWKDVHLKLLFFGRYLCKKKNPDCNNCPFNENCECLVK